MYDTVRYRSGRIGAVSETTTRNQRTPDRDIERPVDWHITMWPRGPSLPQPLSPLLSEVDMDVVARWRVSGGLRQLFKHV